MRKKQIHMLGIILILAVSMANRALADGTLQYWGEMISDGGGKKGDLCSLIGGLGGAPHRYGRYSLYEFDPEDAILTEENVQVYRGGGCTVFFDLHLNQDAVNALLEDQLAVQLEVCRVGESCTFQDVAVLALDEPVDTVLDKLWAVVVAQGNDDLQSQIDTHVTADNDLSSSNELQTLMRSGPHVTMARGGGTISVNDGDYSQANEPQHLSRVGLNLKLSKSAAVVNVADNDNNPFNELQNWPLPGTPNGFLDGTDNDTRYNGTDFALSGQFCSPWEKVIGIDGGGHIVCAPDL